MNIIAQSCERLRQAMKAQGFSAWIIPTADPHLSEYLPEHWQSREYFSGFTGSAGTLVITLDEAGLWTDSRYWEQAEKQLKDSTIQLHKMQANTPDFIAWLIEKLPENSHVGIANDMISLAAARSMHANLQQHQITLNFTSDLAASVWENRPSLPQQNVYPHLAQFTSASAAEKLQRIRLFMQEKQADYHLISALDDIAWITNLRGNDVPYNPVFLSYLLIEKEQATLFADTNKFGDIERKLLKQAQIDLADYHAIHTKIEKIAKNQANLLIDPNKTALSTLLPLNLFKQNASKSKLQLIESINPSTLFKAEKTPQEIANIRQAMIQDGVALCGFFAELEQKIQQNICVNELDIDAMLIQHRSQQAHYVSPSFATIAGFNANGALPHYRALPEAYSIIEKQGLLLIDSGAQYHCGTTDITRVVAIGTPNDAQKRDFTLVLKAHIALAQAIFPENLPAAVLDGICRAPLWQAQCDFGHGTGHGVGYFLNVHEGPQAISYHALSRANNTLKVGMLTSNEPGLYRPNQWGIRIENLVVCQAMKTNHENPFGSYLHFETVTLCPIDTRLIEKSLLENKEISWLNQYHAEVRSKLLPHTEGIAQQWLLRATEAI